MDDIHDTTAMKQIQLSTKGGIVTCITRAGEMGSEAWDDGGMHNIPEDFISMFEYPVDLIETLSSAVLKMVAATNGGDRDYTHDLTANHVGAVSITCQAVMGAGSDSVSFFFVGTSPAPIFEPLGVLTLNCTIEKKTGNFITAVGRHDNEIDAWLKGFSSEAREAAMDELFNVVYAIAVAFFALGGVEGISQQFDN